jgi:hypothetical protein
MPAHFHMTKVKFIQDFQGVETGGVFYTKGQVVSFDFSVAARLIADKRAELIEEKHYGGQAEPELRHDEEIYPAPVEQVEVIQPKKRGRK